MTCERCGQYEAAFEKIRVALFPLAGSLDILSIAIPSIITVGAKLRQAVIDVAPDTEPSACPVPNEREGRA